MARVGHDLAMKPPPRGIISFFKEKNTDTHRLRKNKKDLNSVSYYVAGKYLMREVNLLFSAFSIMNMYD